MTAQAGAKPASGPAAQQAHCAPGLTCTGQPNTAATCATMTAARREPQGRNRHAGEGR